MSLDCVSIMDYITSFASTQGVFERVNSHEPKNSPGNGLTCAVWVDRIDPYAKGSGMDQTAARVTFNIRIYSNMVQEPQDAIDPRLVSAVDLLFAAYSGDFNFGGTVRNVDLLGEAGTPMSAQAGYLQADNKMYRVVTIILPLIVNDAWTQVA